MRFGELCAEKRQQEHLSQKSLAHLVGACQSQIAKIELGSRLPWFGLTNRICEILKISPAELEACEPMTIFRNERDTLINQKLPLTQPKIVRREDDVEQSFS